MWVGVKARLRERLSTKTTKISNKKNKANVIVA